MINNLFASFSNIFPFSLLLIYHEIAALIINIVTFAYKPYYKH